MFSMALCLEKLWFQPFLPIFYLIGSSRSAGFFFSSPPPILPHSDFMKLLTIARLRTCQVITAISPRLFDNLGKRSHCGGWLGAKSKLIGLSINQEASRKELQGVRKTARRRTSPRRSGGSMSASKNTLTLPGPMLKKPKNLHAFIYNGFIFIDVFRELSNTLCTHIYGFLR
jgi:hypothetical protein